MRKLSCKHESVWQELSYRVNNLHEKSIKGILLVFSLAHVLLDINEGEKFMLRTAAHYKGTVKMFWFHF